MAAASRRLALKTVFPTSQVKKNTGRHFRSALENYQKISLFEFLIQNPKGVWSYLISTGKTPPTVLKHTLKENYCVN